MMTTLLKMAIAFGLTAIAGIWILSIVPIQKASRAASSCIPKQWDKDHFYKNEGRKNQAVRYYCETAESGVLFLPGSVVLINKSTSRTRSRTTPISIHRNQPKVMRSAQKSSAGTTFQMFYRSSPSVEPSVTSCSAPTAFTLVGTNTTSINSSEDVWYKAVYPGVDCRYYIKDDKLKTDIYAISPEACEAIELSFDTADSIAIADDQRGYSVFKDGDVIQESGMTAFQILNGRPTACKSGYYLKTPRSIGVDVDGYNGAPVFIDPVYSTYLGGDSDDVILDMDVFQDTLVYCLMETQSSDIDIDKHGYATTYKGGFETLVLTMNIKTKQITNKTYFGSSNADMATGLRIVDSMVVILGATESSDFPVTPDAFSKKLKGIRDQFIAVFDLDCRKLLYSTYFGGDDIESTWSLSADKATGRVAFGGSTSSATAFPVTPANVQSTYGGGEVDGYFGVFNVRSKTFEWSTYLGGNHIDEIMSVVLLGDTILFGGQTASNDFPTTSDAIMRNPPNMYPAVFGRIHWKLSKLLYSTHYGGEYGEDVACVSQTTDGGMLVTGTTNSYDFPTTAGVIKPDRPKRGWNTYIVKLDSGNQLGWSTLFGGDYGVEFPYNIADFAGYIWLFGATGSVDYPKTDSVGVRDWIDATLSVLTRDGRNLKYSLVYAGSFAEGFQCHAFTSTHLLVGGCTLSNNFPITDDALHVSPASTLDAFLVIFRVKDIVVRVDEDKIHSIEAPLCAVFPNPASNVLHLHALHESINTFKVTIWDMNGREVVSLALKEGSVQSVDLTRCHPGLYFAEISGGEKHEVHKFMKM